MTLTITQSWVQIRVRELGFVVRIEDDEYRLARPLTDYRHYAREDQRRLQELHAYYTDDASDCVATAEQWAQTLGRLAIVAMI